MRYFIDLHTHSIASDHAYSTIKENIDAALEKKMHLLGLTEHGPLLNDAPHAWHFMNMQAIPAQIGDLRILKGIEANIVNMKGDIDCDDDMYRRLDYVMAGLHTPVYMPITRDEGTAALIQAIKNPKVNIITHPDNPKFPVHMEAVAEAACVHHVALELNASSPLVRPGSEKYCLEMIAAVKDAGGYLALGSDAHFYTKIGDLAYCEEMLKKCNFNPDKVINSSVETVLNFFALKKRNKA